MSSTLERETPLTDEKPSGRREFLGKLGKAAILGTAAQAILPLTGERSSTVAAQARGNVNSQRASACMQLRMNAAQLNYQNTSNMPRVNNGDEGLYSNKIASYSKGLPHLPNGEVDLNAYYLMLNALSTGDTDQFEAIPLGGNRKLTNPQSGIAFDMEGADPFALIQPPPPAFASREVAAEISENYWMALLRDVPMSDYESNPIANAAAADLSQYGGDFKGAKDTMGSVTPRVLFRGLTPGDKSGPFLSQFFYLPCPFGANTIKQKVTTVRSLNDGGMDYMTDFSSWFSIQNGNTPPTGDIFDPVPRCMRNGRDIGQWVHVDVLFQAYFQAFLIISGTLNAPLDPGNPYSNSATQDGFATFGGPHLASLLGEVATRALKTVWNQKWYVHRRLRPEVFAERVDRTAYHGASYPVHQEILNSIATGTRLGGFLPSGNAFLPMAFPEGSPTHPSYGAGHATVAGACSTILKAFMDESTIIEGPVMPTVDGLSLTPYNGGDTLTVGGELNKIASNVALARNVAGVHWRSDGTESLKLGEELAISILRDQRACYNERFNGFTLTKFDGTTITV